MNPEGRPVDGGVLTPIQQFRSFTGKIGRRPTDASG